MPLLKPDSCKPCPFYNLSKYITPDYVVEDSTEMLLAQAPGRNEEEGAKIVSGYGKNVQTEKVRPQPLIGPTGQWLQNEFWPLTRIPYDKVTKANVLKCRPYNSNDLPNIGSNKPVNGISVKELKSAISHCTRTHLQIPNSVKHIMAMGEISLYALTGEQLLNYKKHNTDEHGTSTISEWRGWGLGVDLVEKSIIGLTEYYDCSLAGSSFYPRMVNVFPVIHIAALHQNARLYHATLLDFIRFGKLVRGEWPEALPEIQINVIPSTMPSMVGFDTEYIEGKPGQPSMLTMWSMADVHRNVYAVDSEHSRHLPPLPSPFTLVTQNGIVDLPHFKPLLAGQEVLLSSVDFTMHDCMLAHAVQWTGEFNSLDYQLSKVGRYNRHKHLRESYDAYTKYQYAALDADSTLNSAWRALDSRFKKDQLAWNEYILRRLPLIPIIDTFQQHGIGVWQERVKYIADLLADKIEAIQEEARALTGNANFNIRSNSQIAAALYQGDFNSAKVKDKVKRPPSLATLVKQLKIKWDQNHDEQEIVNLFNQLGKLRKNGKADT